MNKRSLLIVLFAVAALVLSSLACSFGGAPGVSNVRMATDSTGDTNTSTYSPSDDFYVFFDVNSVEVGTLFESHWYALDIDGEDPNTPFSTIEYNLEDGVDKVYFQLYTTGLWPEGTYRVEIYMAGENVGEAQFSVR